LRLILFLKEKTFKVQVSYVVPGLELVDRIILAIMLIVAAVGVAGVAVVGTSSITHHQAKADCSIGSKPYDKSNGKCFHARIVNGP
jgi:hypothetical protein